MSLLRLLLNLHQHQEAFPIHNRQRCLQCGMSREYQLGRERQGSWERDGEPSQHESKVFVWERKV
jgi:hypothetical protein